MDIIHKKTASIFPNSIYWKVFKNKQQQYEHSNVDMCLYVHKGTTQGTNLPNTTIKHVWIVIKHHKTASPKNVLRIIARIDAATKKRIDTIGR